VLNEPRYLVDLSGNSVGERECVSQNPNGSRLSCA
jgi:hypothetical protein